MTTLKMGSRTWVLLNTERVTTEIITKRAMMTTERPYFPIASGLVSHSKRTALRQTEAWAEGRRLMLQLLSGPELKIYSAWQEQESAKLLLNYLKEPEKWYNHHYFYSNAVAHRIVVGDQFWNLHQQDLANFQKVTVEFIRSINASYIDFFPGLARLPGFLQPWRRHWEKMGEYHNAVFRAWWKPVRKALDNGTAAPSFVRDVLLAEETKFRDDDEEAMYLATSIVAAGSDNVRMTMNVFVMAALCFPEAINRAREEIDSVCGTNAERLPTFDDMKDLPYTFATVKEVLRWRPVVPLIPQHNLTRDLDFEGYHFPAGTDFVVNNLAVSAEVEDEDVFRPERWLEGEKAKEPGITHGLPQFGGGKRVCVGYKVAQQELYIGFARLIWGFEFEAVSVLFSFSFPFRWLQWFELRKVLAIWGSVCILIVLLNMIIRQNGPIDSMKLNHDAEGVPFPVKVTVRSKAYEALIEKSAEEASSN